MSGETRRPRARVVVNSGGGSVQGDDPAEGAASIADAFARHGMEASVELTAGAALVATLRAAREQAGPDGRYDIVVVGGGDGSVGAAAGVLADTGIPLGILPLGTLNHFAKDLGLPLDLEGAVATIAAGHARAVDVAEVNGRVFVNNSSVGLYPDMVADRDRQRRAKGLGKWPAALLSTAKVLRRFAVRRLRVAVDGREATFATPLIFVGNNRYQVVLPHPTGRDALDGGQLCLYVVRGLGPWALLKGALRGAWGRGDVAGVEMHVAKEAEIRSPHGRRRLRVALDGEVTRLPQALRYRIRPGALCVLAPPA